MPKRPSRPSLLVLFVAALALLAACGDSDGPTAPPGTTPADTTPDTATPADPSHGQPTPAPAADRHIQFLDGFAAGVKAAGDDDTPVFVYVGRHHPT